MERVALMGTSQIQHIGLALQDEFEVVNLEDLASGRTSLIGKAIAYLHGVMGCDVVYNVFCTNFSNLILLAARFMGKKTVAHWIGSDVRLLLEGKISKRLSRMAARTTFVCFEGLQRDLLKAEVKADILPIIPFNMSFDVCNMPSDHAVLVYLPEGKEHDYGLNEIRDAVAAFPNLRFYIVANSSTDLFPDADNVSILGMLSPEEMEQLYSRISILLRLHTSDGLSMMVLEALAKGKRVIWDHKLQYVLPGSSSEEIIASIAKVIANEPESDFEAHEFVMREYSKKRFLELFRQGINN